MSKKILGIILIIFVIAAIILGIFYYRTVYKTPKSPYNVDAINEKIKNDIDKLIENKPTGSCPEGMVCDYPEPRRVSIYLPNQLLELNPGDNYGVAYGLRNYLKNETRFRYNVELVLVDKNCKIESITALSYIIAGKDGIFQLQPKESAYNIIRLAIPKETPPCLIRYAINVSKMDDESLYASEFFDVQIRDK